MRHSIREATTNSCGSGSSEIFAVVSTGCASIRSKRADFIESFSGWTSASTRSRFRVVTRSSSKCRSVSRPMCPIGASSRRSSRRPQSRQIFSFLPKITKLSSLIGVYRSSSRHIRQALTVPARIWNECRNSSKSGSCLIIRTSPSRSWAIRSLDGVTRYSLCDPQRSRYLTGRGPLGVSVISVIPTPSTCFPS